MTNLNSVSDLARSYQMRLSQNTLKAKLDVLTKETTTGVKADIPQGLGGDLTRITQIESRLTQLKAHGNNLAEAQGLLSGLQAALGNVQALSASTGTLLLSEALVSSDAALRLQVDKAPDEFRTILAAMNTVVGGRFLFSGNRTEQSAVIDYETIMAHVSTAVGTATDAADIATRIGNYFDDPAGFAATGFLGADGGNTSILVSPDQRIKVDITANSSQLRDVFKGFALLSYAADTPALDGATVRSLSRAAGNRLVSGEMQVISARAQVGIQEEAANRIKTTQTAESSALALARNSLISADPYESAAALKEVEANIETIYTLTARLSKLSLTDYL